jgi:RHS repeat-associated protein
MTQDLNKRISSIQYNLLNLPQNITFSTGSTIAYTHDAEGRKLNVTYGSPSKTINYSGNMVYENGTLKQILTEGGYVTFSGSTPVYHAYLKDRQGNNRVVINGSGTVEQVNHYYPFGYFFGESTNADTQRYKYNDKEFDEMHGPHWYDYGARHYDPAIMRFTTMDPMCEKYYHLSPYAYCGNNPVNAVDDEGKKTIFVNGLQKFGSLSGTDYWGGEKGAFVYGAKKFFKDVSTPYFVNYDYALNSENVMSIDALYNQGYNYAKEKYSEITADISKESDVLHFVSHSMGSAFSEGMMTYLSQRGWTIDVAVHMNAWRPHELYGTPGIVRVDATTTFDPVQNLFIGKPIFVSNDIPIANYKLRKKGVFNLFYNHKGLINDGGDIWHPQPNSWNEIMSKIREYVIQNPEIKITVK